MAYFNTTTLVALKIKTIRVGFGLVLFFLPAAFVYAQDENKKTPPPVMSLIQHNFKFGALFWGENINLLTSDGRTENIDVKYSGPSLGYEFEYKWSRISIWTEFATVYMQGQATSEGKSIVYLNKVNPATPVLVDLGVTYYPHSNVSLGIGTGAILHSLVLNPPTSILTTYEFKYSKPLKFFYVIKLAWRLTPNWFIEQKNISFIDSGLNTAWHVSLNYTF